MVEVGTGYGVAPSRMVSVSASVDLPLYHKVQKFSFGTAHPGGPGKRAVKWLWCGDGCGVMLLFPPEVENHFAEKVQRNHIFFIKLKSCELI